MQDRDKDTNKHTMDGFAGRIAIVKGFETLT
jgi:hypothetical protein